MCILIVYFLVNSVKNSVIAHRKTNEQTNEQWSNTTSVTEFIEIAWYSSVFMIDIHNTIKSTTKLCRY